MLLDNQKHIFNIPKDVTYLNIASQSPSFKAIHEAGLNGLLQKQHAFTISISDYFEPVKELKTLFAELIEADDYNQIALIPSASYGMASVANNIRLKPEDEILIVDEQFPSNVYVWQKLATKYGATLKTVSIPQSGNLKGKRLNEAILAAITSKTAVVAMGHIHWTNGMLFDLKVIRKKATAHKALLIIDGSQSVGALPFSVKDIKPDALICAGYKWLFGPYGCAYAYYGKYFENGSPIEENWYNREDSENFAGLTNYESQYKPLANRYNVGECGNFIYVKMQIAALKQVLDWTPQAIQEYCKSISSQAVLKLENLGCTIENSRYRTHHLFGIELPIGLDVNYLKNELEKQKIYVSIRGKYIRISCHLFNTESDFDNLITCIAAVLKTT
ncbi:aminotransferase class V-fold PLP-dependent enzyme [Changchengzhania lutea]|uniref:aminotransferase class V-fold PLP-dependent enzyme n=1 Tax=Changchengzhania lutea TaxID=2049305 RepID=UPI00115CCA51|nr:aminotransferase class V-fold PLP-dependent enzyme [Changchengzhania lutea]